MKIVRLPWPQAKPHHPSLQPSPKKVSQALTNPTYHSFIPLLRSTNTLSSASWPRPDRHNQLRQHNSELQQDRTWIRRGCGDYALYRSRPTDIMAYAPTELTASEIGFWKQAIFESRSEAEMEPVRLSCSVPGTREWQGI